MADERSVGEALDAIPAGPFHRRLLLLTGTVLSFAAVEILLVSFVLPELVAAWDLSGLLAGLLGSASLVGMTGGSSVGGWYADRTGRVTALRWSVVGYAACAALTALSVGFYSAFLFRLLTGVFVGATISIDVSYLTEHLPDADRGKYLVYLEMFWPVGTLLTVGLAWLVLQVLAVDGRVGGIAAWRVLFLVAGLPGLVAPLLWQLSETPYYLASTGHLDTANERLRDIARSNGGAGQFVPATAGVDEEGTAGFGRLFRPGLRARTALASAVWFGLNFGFYGLFIWLPTTLEVVSLAGSTYAQLFAVAAVQLPGVVSASLLVDRVGRRPTIGGYLLLSGAFMALFADALGESLVVGYVPLPPLGSLFLASFFLVGAWGASFAYTTELFPTRVRGTGFGFASAVGKVASIAGPVFVGALVPHGYRVALAPFGVTLLAAGVVVLAFGPETMNEALA